MRVHLEAVKELATHAVRYQDILYSLYQDMLYTSVPEAKRRPFRGHLYPENRFICRGCCYPTHGKTWSSTTCPRQDRYSVPVAFHGHGSFRLRVTAIGNNLRHLWFGIPPLSDVRSQPSGSMVVHLEAVNKPGDACVAPTKIYRTHRAWNAPSAPVPFLCRALPSPSAIIC